MSIPLAPPPAKLIASLLFNPGKGAECHDALHNTIAEMEGLFGPADFMGSIGAFTQTRYYDKEMGQGLLRQFVGFSELVERQQLAEIKLLTNQLEKKCTLPNGGRSINIDPGLLSVENLVLATGKNFTHRIYLHDGIFAEVTLLYQDGGFRSLPWTYWDYAAEDVLKMFESLRKELLKRLKDEKFI